MELQKIYSEEKGKIVAFAESRIGGRPENQDSFGWKDTSKGYLVTVCDGMGGGPGGKTASTIAVREIITAITDADDEEETSNIIIKAIRRANMAIIEATEDNPKLKGMGATATVLLISDKSAHIAHVGDSRVYQLRGGKKIFRTFDHSLVFDMVAQGVITEEQARLSAQSNVITRALGIKADVEVDIREVAYEKGDRFLLCSDGIHGTMPEEKLIKLVTSKKNKLGALVDDIATSVDNEGRMSGGGHDNLTIALIETLKKSEIKDKMTKQAKTIIFGTLALLILSIVMNCIQFSSPSAETNTVNADSLNAKIKELEHAVLSRNKDLHDIEEQVDKISASNITPVDSIKKIIKNNK